MGRLLEEIDKEFGTKAPKGFNRTGLKLDNYIDNVEEFHKEQPFFYSKTNIFWFWNKEEYKYEITDEVDLMNLLDQELGFGGQTVSNKVKSNYLEAFKRVGRRKQPVELEKNCVQFKRQIINIKTKIVTAANPNVFATNPIPQEVSQNSNTPTIDRLFTEWVGNDQKEILYEIMAYSCVNDYPIHTLFALIGSGRNGKSRYLELINRFVGRSNVTSTELDDLLENRFEKAKLYKKLVCVMGETNFGTLQKTSLLKKLTGGDLIGFEFKNKNPFDDYNYAKILISSNSLPSSDDTSEGFYRRWIIINFPNNFAEGKDILETIPQEEYSNLANKIIQILIKLIERGSFTNQGSIEQRRENYIKASNPLKIFIKEHCEFEENSYVKYNELYNSYSQYLLHNKQRVVSKKEFSSVLNQEGLIVDRTSKKVGDDYVNGMWVTGLKFVNVVKVMNDFSLSFSRMGKELEIDSQPSQPAQEKEGLSLNFEEVQNILLDRVGQEIETNTLISYGVCEKDIQKWKDEGLIYEPRSGFIRLL